MRRLETDTARQTRSDRLHWLVSVVINRTIEKIYLPIAGDIDRDPVEPVGEGVGLMAWGPPPLVLSLLFWLVKSCNSQTIASIVSYDTCKKWEYSISTRLQIFCARSQTKCVNSPRTLICIRLTEASFDFESRCLESTVLKLALKHSIQISVITDDNLGFHGRKMQRVTSITVVIRWFSIIGISK